MMQNEIFSLCLYTRLKGIAIFNEDSNADFAFFLFMQSIEPPKGIHFLSGYGICL